MKKLIIIVLLTLMSCLVLTACSKKSDTDDSIIVMEMSDEAKQYQKDTYDNGSSKAYLTEENFEMVLASLSARDGKQVISGCEVTNKLDSFVCEGSNVYTLSKENYENIVLYIHGGGWAFEIGSGHISFCDMLVDTLNAKVYMPLYPLTPQATADETYAMIETLYKELLKEDKKYI